MDDHSFEEFLKGRLENIEADPATDAWDKIFGEISQDSPVPVQKKPWFVRKLWLLAACMLWLIPQDTHHIVSQKNSSPTIAQGQGKLGYSTIEQKQSTHQNNEKAQIIGNRSVKVNSKSTSQKYPSSLSKTSIANHQKKEQPQHLDKQTNVKPNTKPQQKMPSTPLTNNTIAITTTKANTTHKKVVKKTPVDGSKRQSKQSMISKAIITPPTKTTRTRLQIPLINSSSMSSLAFVPFQQTELNTVALPKKKARIRQGLLVRAFVAPNYNAYRLVTNKEDNEVIQDLSKNKVFSSNNLGFSGGLMLESHLSRRWSIVWGLSYTELNNRVRYNSTNALPDSIAVNVINKSRIEVTPIYNTETKNYQYKYQDIGVQLGVNYLLFGKGWQHQLYLGAAANRVTKTITQTQDEVLKESSSQIQPMINVGYDMRIPLGKRVGFYLKPTFNYYLNAINQANTAYEVKPFFTSLRVGLIWKLK